MKNMDKLTNNFTTLNFKAKPVMPSKVLKKIAGNYLPKEAHIIEMNYSDIKDAKALDVIKEKWAKSQFSAMICSNYTSPQRKIYAITSQNNDFANPVPEKIMGLADFLLKGDNANLRFLQADPNIINSSDRTIIGVGKNLMEGVVENLKSLGFKTMDLFAEQRVKPFYKKVFPTIQDKESTMESYTNLILDIK